MTKVKICGLSTPEAVATAVEAGADYIGFVFAKSKRQVSLEQARELAKGVTGQTKIVGVFVSPSLEELEEAINHQAQKGYRLHTITTSNGGSKGLMGGDRIQATMVFEKVI